MAVFTTITKAEAQKFINLYDLGEITTFVGITEGSENTNYKICTDSGEYILTIFEERTHREDLPTILSFINHLKACKLPLPVILTAADGENIHNLKDKPAILQSFLSGRPILTPTPNECYESGKMLGKLHEASAKFNGNIPNHLGLGKLKTMMKEVENKLNDEFKTASNDLILELDTLQKIKMPNIPKGLTHADWFKDNLFFENSNLTGIIDLWLTCNETFMYDLAIALNAWCFPNNGEFSPKHFNELLKGYKSVRLLTNDEGSSLLLELRRATARFLTTRLYDSAYGQDVSIKPPLTWHKRLKFHQSKKVLSDYAS